MNEVTLTRTIAADPETIRAAMTDVGPFTEAAGFDRVDVDGRTIAVANDVGITTIQLTLELVEDPEADLAYEQREGIFEEMRTTYTVTPVEEGSEVTATTAFALDVAVVGDLLDATIIARQRRAELAAQFDWLETVCVD